jgi:ADP-L-glycero-D-manno-heptose 6-epimerase
MKHNNIDFNNKSVLITGGAGFIGSNLAFYFQKFYPTCKIVIVDCFRGNKTLSNGNLASFGHYKNLIGFNGTVISGDINDKYIIKNLKDGRYKFDYIFHQAAISDTTANEQDLMIKTNVNAFEAILQIALKHNANVVYASSAATYGDAISPQTLGEENPQNVYGFSKLMMDNIAQKYITIEEHKQTREGHSVSIVGLRYFNVYGDREFFKNKTASMVLQLGHQILSNNSPKLFENSDKILRDFIYIDDVIQANIKACDVKKGGIYNVGTSISRSFQDIADILQNQMGTALGTTYIPNPYTKQYQFHTQANIDDIRKDLGYEPRFSLENGIMACLPYIIKTYKSEVLK